MLTRSDASIAAGFRCAAHESLPLELEGGCINAPLPGYFTPARLQHVLADAGVDAVLTDQPQRLQAHGCARASVPPAEA